MRSQRGRLASAAWVLTAAFVIAWFVWARTSATSMFVKAVEDGNLRRASAIRAITLGMVRDGAHKQFLRAVDALHSKGTLRVTSTQIDTTSIIGGRQGYIASMDVTESERPEIRFGLILKWDGTGWTCKAGASWLPKHVQERLGRIVSLEGLDRGPEGFDVEGALGRTEIVEVDKSVASKLAGVRKRLKVIREPEKAQAGDTGSPQTLQEAAEYLGKHISMACPPAVCAEYEGVFYFSGGTSTRIVEDWSTGYALKKGERRIQAWDALKDGIPTE